MHPAALNSKTLPSEPSQCRSQRPKALALVGAHDRLLQVVSRQAAAPARVLDVGAGEGALSLRLLQAGYQVEACDLLPESFRAAGITCRKADLHERLPYENESFDVVVCAEVVEHLESQLRLFQEVQRILQPGGCFVFSTPNIASFKSRLTFLLTGYFYSHGPLDPNEYDPVSQHIAAFTPDRYFFLLGQAGLRLTKLETDKYQRSSLVWAGLAPLVRLVTRAKYGRTPGTVFQNSWPSLLGRTLIGVARKAG